MKSVLITGGAGFVGLHAIEASLARGLEVRVLDNFSSSRKDRLRSFDGRIRLYEADVRDARAVRRAIAGCDAVFHLAAIRSVVKTVEDPLLSHEVNATGALVLMHEAHRAGVKHFLFTSTSAVYGEAMSASQKEDGLLRPISPYGAAKLAAEHYLRVYFREKKLRATTVRIFNVYGPRQNPESRYSLVVPAVLEKIKKEERPVIDGSGTQARDFVYIGDVIDAFFKILGNPAAYGKTYNLGSGHAVSVNRLVSLLLQLTGSRLKPVHGPRRPGDPEKTCADIGRARRDLDWRPHVPLERGLKETVKWFFGENQRF